MQTEEKVKRVLNILECYLLNECQKQNFSEESVYKFKWECGAAWMANLILENFKDLDFDKIKGDNIVKTRALWNPGDIEKVIDSVRNSHIDLTQGDLIAKKGNMDTDNSKQTCKECNYAKKKRPDGIAMLGVNVWCTRIRNEMPASMRCAVGKWGFF